MEESSLTKAIDPVGLETLELFADTDHFNKWLFETLAPYFKDNLLEIGSGIGNISAFLIDRFKEVTLSDLRETYCSILRTKFEQRTQLKEVVSFDLSEKDIRQKHPELVNRFDTIIASNVVEHIEQDDLAIRNCQTLLRTGGRLVVLVPAYSFLYNQFDRELGHYRRYNETSLKNLFEKQGFRVIHTRYFNVVGILGWWLSGTVLKKKMIPKDQLNAYNKLIPVIKMVDTLVMHRAGLSVIGVGEKI
jgi:SAM-dependent methyltransferase